jgi:hypothetical protein
MPGFPNNGGGYQVGDGNTNEVQLDVLAAPVSSAVGAITLSVAQLTSRLIVTTTSASAYTYTLPTGAVMDASPLLANAKTGSSFDFTIVNTGTSSGIVTMTAAASGFSIVGLATIAVSTSATFRARRAGDNTWVLYRIAS